jgi:hypothetical protein
MWRRNANIEDPWIATEEYSNSGSNPGTLYYEGSVSDSNYLQTSGAYVMIRNKAMSDIFTFATQLDGGGWTVRRFVPGNGKWHPATDYLVGTDVYGTTGSTTDAWSIEYKSDDFDQFLLMNGDGTKWMIMSRL